MSDPIYSVVVLVGPKGSGKSTAAGFLAWALRQRLLERPIPVRVHVDSFAAPVKAIAAAYLGLTEEELRDKDREVYGRTVRHWLQRIGTEWGRDGVHRDVWVHRLIDRLRPGITVVDDGRFPNEVELDGAATVLRAAVAVHAVGVWRTQVVDTWDQHASEASARELLRDLRDTGRLLLNDGSKDDLKEHCWALAKELVG